MPAFRNVTIKARLKQLLAAQEPHLVQTFLFHANIVGRIAARRAGVRAVASGIRVAQRQGQWRLRLDRLTGRWVDVHVCVSRSVAEFAEKIAGLPGEKLAVIPNGVDLRRFPAQGPAELRTCGIAPGRRVVTFVGRLHRQKGVAWLLETAPCWLEQIADCDLLLVGKGPQRAQLEGICRRLGITDRVHFAGWRADVPQILAASELLVLPSAWEGMPNAVLEAMASRLPVVATNVEGVGELLGPGATEQTVPYGDRQALTKKLVRLLSEPHTAGKLGAANRRRVEEHFSLSAMTAAYEQLWESLVVRQQ